MRNGKLGGHDGPAAGRDQADDSGRSELPHTAAVLHLDILVENTGRINYSHQLRGERKGLGSLSRLNGEPMQWLGDLSAADGRICGARVQEGAVHAGRASIAGRSRWRSWAIRFWIPAN